MLRQAKLQGLNPLDYATDSLQRQLRSREADTARFDAALTSAMVHYLADLRVGRVRSDYHTRLPDPRPRQYDPVERLGAGLPAGKLQAAVQAAEPQIWQYGRVKAALAHYRELSKQSYPALPQPGARVVPDGAYPAVKALYARSVLLGELATDAPPPPEGIHSDRMQEGVQHFQARHGLDEDGVLGLCTIDAFNVPPAQRVRQLELTLERLRWLPDFSPRPLIMVNLAAYRLWALHHGSDKAPLKMRVVVGSSIKTETPLFVGQLRYLELDPYWNVPRSILEKDILPKLGRNRAYLRQNGMETVPPVASAADLQAGRACASARVRKTRWGRTSSRCLTPWTSICTRPGARGVQAQQARLIARLHSGRASGCNGAVCPWPTASMER